MTELVAVYGSLREGLGNNPRLHNSPKLGTCIVEGFEMRSLGGFPVIYFSDMSDKIVVEVYQVEDSVLEGSLDTLEGHPEWYRRIMVPTEFGNAWIYVMMSDEYRNHPLVEGGDWCKYKTWSRL